MSSMSTKAEDADDDEFDDLSAAKAESVSLQGKRSQASSTDSKQELEESSSVLDRPPSFLSRPSLLPPITRSSQSQKLTTKTSESSDFSPARSVTRSYFGDKRSPSKISQHSGSILSNRSSRNAENNVSHRSSRKSEDNISQPPMSNRSSRNTLSDVPGASNRSSKTIPTEISLEPVPSMVTSDNTLSNIELGMSSKQSGVLELPYDETGEHITPRSQQSTLDVIDPTTNLPLMQTTRRYSIGTPDDFQHVQVPQVQHYHSEGLEATSVDKEEEPRSYSYPYSDRKADTRPRVVVLDYPQERPKVVEALSDTPEKATSMSVSPAKSLQLVARSSGYIHEDATQLADGDRELIRSQLTRHSSSLVTISKQKVKSRSDRDFTVAHKGSNKSSGGKNRHQSYDKGLIGNSPQLIVSKQGEKSMKPVEQASRGVVEFPNDLVSLDLLGQQQKNVHSKGGGEAILRRNKVDPLYIDNKPHQEDFDSPPKKSEFKAEHIEALTSKNDHCKWVSLLLMSVVIIGALFAVICWLIITCNDKCVCDDDTAVVVYQHKEENNTLDEKILAPEPVYNESTAKVYRYPLPQVVGFTAWAKETQTFAEKDTVEFHGIHINEGYFYDQLSSRFFCPYTGIYFISINLKRTSNSQNVILENRDASLSVGLVDNNGLYFHNTASNSFLVECKQGDSLTLKGAMSAPPSGYGTMGDSEKAWSSFTVLLMPSENVVLPPLKSKFYGFSAYQPALATYRAYEPVMFSGLLMASPDYDPSLARFTCPVAGIYFVSVNIRESGASPVNVQVMLGTSPILHISDFSNGEDNVISNSRFFNCKPGQSVLVSTVTESTVYGHENKYSTFSVMMVSRNGSTDFVGFSACRKEPQFYHNDEIIVFDHFFMNAGLFFDGSTFSCPKTGIYFLSINIMRLMNKPVYATIYRGEEVLFRLEDKETGYNEIQHNMISMTGLFRCSVKDKVQVRAHGSGGMYGAMENYYSTFSIMLLL